VLPIEREERARTGGRARSRSRLVAATGHQRERRRQKRCPVHSAPVKILVTGASGLVGRALVEELQAPENPHEVLGLERQHGDLSAGEHVAGEYMRDFRPELVVHLAARVGVALCESDPADAIRSNVTATAHVARATHEYGARLAYASTVSVNAPTSLYALTKHWGEQVAELYAPEGLQVLRLAHPYGPGVEPGRGRGALPTLLWQAEQREPITVYRGDSRSWCWAGDVASAIRLVLEAGEAGAVDIGRGDEPVAMTELAQRACELTGAPQELIEEVDPPAGFVPAGADDGRLRELGWVPEVDLDAGMRRLLEWLRAESATTVS